MNNYKKPYVIAEIGCNHKGEMEIAKELCLKGRNKENEMHKNDRMINALKHTHE